MKKLALLLGSLLVVGVTAQAKEVIVAPVEESKEIVVVAEPVVEEVAVVVEEPAPALKVTNFRLWTENDNNSGNSDGDIGETYFGTDIGLATENWTFGVTSYKSWKLDSDEGVIDTDSRLQVEAWRAFNKEGEFKYSLGTRVRMQNSYDRYYLRGKYSYGMFNGWGYTGYTATTDAGKADYYYSEAMPLNISLGPVTVGYYLENKSMVGSSDDGEFTQQQARVWFPLYASEAMELGFEYRLGIKQTGKGTADEYDFGDMNAFIVNALFPVTQNSAIDTYYRYDIKDYKGQDTTYYGEFGLGWNYTF